MALDLGTKKTLKSSNQNVIDQQRVFVPTGYRSSESGQTEIFAIIALTDANFTTLYTVTTGKTLFITDMIFASTTSTASNASIGKNSAADLTIHAGSNNNTIINLSVPMKYTSGTVVQGQQNNGTADVAITIIGFEE